MAFPKKMRNSRLNIVIPAFLAGIFFCSGVWAQGDNSENRKEYELFMKIAAADSVAYSAIRTNEYFLEKERERTKHKAIKLGADKGWWRTLEPVRYSNEINILLDNVYYEIFTDSDTVKAWQRRRSGKGIDYDNIALILKNYTVRFLPDETIQDYPVTVAIISPKQKDRPWRKIWVHKYNGFVFRLEEYGLNGTLAFRQTSEDVVFNPRVDSTLFDVKYEGEIPDERRRKLYDSIADVQRDLDIPLVAPTVQPPGFVLGNIAVMHQRKEPVVQFYYTDGILSFSLFQRRTDRRNRKMRTRRHHGRLFMSAVKNKIYYRFEGDIEYIARETITQCFKSIDLVAKNKP